LGAVLDPFIDRIFIVALLFAFWWAELITVKILSLIIARDLLLLLVNFGLNRKLKVEVVYLGKMGTWIIFVAFALMLISQPMAPNFIEAFAAAGIIWGVIIYWLAGLEYLKNIWSSKS
jgi:phosphatidylglycerophosphate synthase